MRGFTASLGQGGLHPILHLEVTVLRGAVRQANRPLTPRFPVRWARWWPSSKIDLKCIGNGSLEVVVVGSSRSWKAQESIRESPKPRIALVGFALISYDVISVW